MRMHCRGCSRILKVKTFTNLVLAFLFVVSPIANQPANAVENQTGVKLRPINPSSSIENPSVNEFAKTMIQVYTLFAKLLDPKENNPNFIFLSGRDLIVDKKLNLDRINEFFPGMTQAEADLYTGEADFCLVFNLQLTDAQITVGVNEASQITQNTDSRCFLETLAFFFHEDGHESLRADTVREHARNIVNAIVEKANE